ncbi:MAG: ACT domain-containing protein [Desulfobacterota bacterium]|nr:ACT domain-containing protein [Thermodesulfobacteriota bacterium]
MKVQQVSVFLENKSGRLAEVTRVLARAGINIRALCIADTSDFGILRLIVNDVDKAMTVLKDNDFTASKTDVVAVEVPDTPGGLSRILDILEHHAINVEYMYAFVERSSDNAIIMFRFDDNDKAIATLSAAGITILKGEKVYSI